MRRTPRCRPGTQLLEKPYDLPALQLPANNHLADSINTVHLKDRLSDIKTDCCDRLHAWLLRIVGASTGSTSMALACRWRSRPQHQKRTSVRLATTSYLCRQCPISNAASLGM